MNGKVNLGLPSNKGLLEKPRLLGEITIRHIRGGKVIHEETLKNIITDAGYAGVAGLMINTGVTAHFDYIALGTSSQAESTGDTALIAETSGDGLTRASATPTRVTTSQTDDTMQLVKEFTFSGSTITITEAGILNASSSGVLLARKKFTGIALATNDKLSITWKVQVAV